MSRRRPPRRLLRFGARRGTTLVEVVVAVAILATTLVAMARFAGAFAGTVNDSELRGRAAQLAADRLERVKASTDYDSLEVDFAESTPTPVAGAAPFRRQTLVRRIGGGPGDLVDYKVVTVIVTAPPLRAPVRRTTAISDR